jgi:hypothetical protein
MNRIGIAFAIYQVFVLVIVVMYLAVHVIETIDWKTLAVTYRTRKVEPPTQYEMVTLPRVAFVDEDDEAIIRWVVY